MTNDNRLPRSCILKSSARIADLFSSGSRVRGRFVTLYSLPSERPRAAFIVPKRYGKAVLRNQQKRRMREAYRQHRGWFTDNRDLLFYMHPARQKGRQKGPLPVQKVAAWQEILLDLQHVGARREKARH